MHEGTAGPTTPPGPTDGPIDGTTDATPGATPGSPTDATTGATAAGPTRPRRGRRGVVLGLVAAVVAAGVGTAAALGVFDGGEPIAAPSPAVVVLPSPTPTVAPAAREPLSAFADALPSSVLGYALASIAEEQPLLLAGAVEGYRVSYTDGAQGTVTVLAGQWRTPESAAAALAALTAGGTPVDDGEPASGEVLVGGAPVGTWTLTQAADGSGTLTWTNGSALLQAVAPLDVVRDLYSAYPL